MSDTGQKDNVAGPSSEKKGVGDESIPTSAATLQLAQLDRQVVQSTRDILQLRTSLKKLEVLQRKQQEEIEGKIATAGNEALRAAESTAGVAQEAADEAQRIARTAQEVADKAQRTAGTAQEVADEAQRTAGTAQEVADEAQRTAGTAQEVAGEAQRTAGTAQEAANKAQTTAGTAQEAANEAQTTAGTAQEAANEAQTTAGTAQTAIETIQQEVESITTAKEQALGRRQKLFPWIIGPLVLNLLLWLFMLYIIFRAQDYSSQGTQAAYLTRRLMIIAIPNVFPVVVAVVLIICLSKFKKRLDTLHDFIKGEFWQVAVLLLNAAACFVLVTAYLYVSALPQYNHPTFQSSIEYTESLPWPSVVFNYLPSDGLTLTTSVCVISEANGGFFDCTLALQLYSSDGVEVPVFNTSYLNPEARFATGFDARITMVLQFEYNSTVSSEEPSLNLQLLDSRITFDELSDCDLVAFQRIPLVTTSYIGLTVEHVIDSLGVIPNPAVFGSHANQDCQGVFRRLLSTDPPYSSYTATFISNPSKNTTECDVAKGSQQPCLEAVTISFSSKIVRTTETIHGISKLDIWINAAAIVGAIQFFAFILKGSAS